MLILPLFSLLLACPGQNDTPSPTDTFEVDCTVDRGEPAVSIGEGQTEYLPLNDLQEVLIERGPQGGIHIWISARFTGIAPGPEEVLPHPDHPLLTFRVTVNGTVVAGYEDAQRPLEQIGVNVLERVGEQLIFDVGDFNEVFNQQAEIFISATDACGTTASNTINVVLSPG